MSDAEVRRQTFKRLAAEKSSRTRHSMPLQGLKNAIALGVMLCLSITPQVSRGQGEPPPVLDPADIFTDAVEVVETLPILNADNNARMLWYFDPAEMEWRGYAYPEEIEAEEYPPVILQRSDGTYAISEEGFYGFSEFAPEAIWILNPDTGEMTHPEEACGRMKDLPNEGIWIIYENPDDGLYYLCFTETGELSDPIPNNIQSDLCGEYWRRPTVVSPDSKWVVFTDCAFDPNPVAIYAYETATRQFRFLGNGAEVDNEIVEIERWLDNSTPIIFFSAIRNPSYHSIYVADLTQVNSAQLVARVLSFLDADYWPSYYDDPPRYEWVPSEHDRNRPDGRDQDLHPSCQLHSFDLQTRTETVYPPISGVCGEGTVIPDGSGDRLYRSVNTPAPGYPVPSATATIIRFNPATSKRDELYTGEIEWLDGLSPSGTYAVFVTDDSGGVDVGESFTWSQNYVWWEWIPSPRYALFDLTSNEFVPDAPDNGIEWIDDKTYLSLDRLVTLEGNSFDEISTDGILSAAPNKRQLLVINDSDDPYAASVLNIANSQTTPIIHNPNNDQYHIRYDWQSIDELQVTVIDLQHDDLTLGRWLVRIPDTP
jgi:hypothetical protein